MLYIKFLLRSTAVGMVLASELAIAVSIIAIAPSTATTLPKPGQLLAQQTHKQTASPPPRRNPGSSAAGGRRNPTACPQDAPQGAPQDTVVETTSPPLTALSPITEPGLTLATHPTFLIYVPRTSAETAEFSLSTRDGRGIYRTTINLTNTPDIVSITIPEQTEPLEVGRTYMWVFAVICNPNRRMADQFVMSSIQRTELAPARLRQIEQTPIRERIALYQEDGIWHDALTLLFELKRDQPNDPEIDMAWHEFLQLGGVDIMININSTRAR